MFAYYLELALRSLRRSPVLTALMVIAIGLGIGASMTMFTVLHVMSGDPLPERSGQLFYPHIDPLPINYKQGSGAPDAANNFSWPDAMNILHARRAERQAAMAGGSVLIRPSQADSQPFFETGHYVTADFFAMFGVPFKSGSGWTAAEDEQRAQVVVIQSALSRRLFASTDSVGKTLRLKDRDFRIVGVIDDWQPQPNFYTDISGHAFGEPDQFFLPLTTAMEFDFDTNGNRSCWGKGDDRLDSGSCTWLQVWVELSSAAQVASYQQFLADYSLQQKELGRFERPVDARLYGLMDWLRHANLVPGDVRLQFWLAVGFLLVCLVNTTGLLLAKFLRRSAEVSVRRALGARRRNIFAQLGIESLVIGFSGGVLGLLLAQLGLWTVRQRPDDYARLAQMDMPMLALTLVLAVVVSVLAALLPAWRACRIAPALQLKSQ